jgi:protein-S-isoprenylcysteine O-methyltransferase Ste14
VVPLAVGASFIGWAIASHYQAAPEESGITVVPEYLVTRGAYSISRNPLYVGGGLLWAGWAIFFGNARVALAGGGWLTLITTLGVPFEERLLRRKFGSAYDTYCRRVPRWLGLRPEVRASP